MSVDVGVDVDVENVVNDVEDVEDVEDVGDVVDVDIFCFVWSCLVRPFLVWSCLVMVMFLS